MLRNWRERIVSLQTSLGSQIGHRRSNGSGATALLRRFFAVIFCTFELPQPTGRHGRVDIRDPDVNNSRRGTFPIITILPAA